MNLARVVAEILKNEKSGGVVLVICTLVSLALTNSPSADWYLPLWSHEVAGHSIRHWINEGLMTAFFLLIGLELEREIYTGELKKLKEALLPAAAALGGMLIPAGIHILLNSGTPYSSGFGIPMATDIAFALGVLSLLGSRVPAGLRIFVMAFAVIDDLCSIIVIALFYTGSIHWGSLGIALGILSGLLVLNRLRVYTMIPYLISGVVMWYFMLESGIHPTTSGVLLAFAIPFQADSKQSPSFLLEKRLHHLVAFLIVPVFALANTTIVIDNELSLLNSNTLGILLGLLIGKPAGIIIFCYLAVKLKITSVPAGISFRQVAGAGFLGGIGFTMSIFITLLAFQDDIIVTQSKVAVMIASVISGTTGYFILRPAHQSI